MGTRSFRHANLYIFRDELLRDKRITNSEVDLIQDCITHNGQLDMEDVRLLVELLSGAEHVCLPFDHLFFPVLKSVLLEDRQISAGKRFYLLKMLYSSPSVRSVELDFFREIQQELPGATSPEFRMLCESALPAVCAGQDNSGDTDCLQEN